MLGIEDETVPVDLPAKEQKSAEHLARNPQGLVPALEIDGLRLTVAREHSIANRHDRAPECGPQTQRAARGVGRTRKPLKSAAGDTKTRRDCVARTNCSAQPLHRG